METYVPAQPAQQATSPPPGSPAFYDKLLAWLVFLSFFVPGKPQVFIVIPICAYWLIRDSLTGRRTQVGRRPVGWALLLSSLYLLQVIALPFTEPAFRPDIQFNLEQKASLLLLPLVFCCVSDRTKTGIRSQLPVFAYATLFFCLRGNLLYLTNCGYVAGPTSSVDYRVCFEAMSGLHPTYMGMYLCFSALILLMPPAGQPPLARGPLGALLLLLFLCLLALIPKAPIIGLMFALGYYAWQHRNRRDNITFVAGAWAGALVLAYLFIPFLKQRIDEIASVSQPLPDNHPAATSMTMRHLIWTIDQNLWRDHWLTGVGPGRLKAALEAQYAYYSRVYGHALEYYDTHNEYLNQWLSFGLIGIALFAVVLLVQFGRAFAQRDSLYVALLLLLTTVFFTENVLSVQQGVVFYALFTSLFFFDRWQSGHPPTKKGTEAPSLVVDAATAPR